MSLSFARLAGSAASAKTMEETVLLDVGDLFGITDYFLIASGRNDRQVRAIVDEVTRQLREAGAGSPLRTEGGQDAKWVLLDYGDLVVHVFDAEIRAFYDLERLWSDAPRIPLEPVLAGEASTS